jgi:hypothetical protein
MGIICKLELANLKLDNCYINICKFIVKKYGNFQLITITYNIYMNYENRQDERTPLYEKQYTFSTDKIPHGDIYSFLYYHLKTLYNNSTDYENNI